MRKSHFIGLIIVCFWAVANYFLFLHQPGVQIDDEIYLDRHIDAMQERMRFQFMENERLVYSFKSRFFTQQTASFSHVLENLFTKKNPLQAGGQTKHQHFYNDSEKHYIYQSTIGDGRNFLMNQQPNCSRGLPCNMTTIYFPAPLGETLKAETGFQNVQFTENHLSEDEALSPSRVPRKSPRELQTEKLGMLVSGGPGGKPAVAVLVLACNRLTVRRCLNELLRYRPSPDNFPIIVSQDCNHAPTADILAEYSSRVLLIQQPDQSEILVTSKEKKFQGYFNIARHYIWALNQTFFHFQFQTAIIVEDDLDVSPDFFEYFSATLPILRRDTSLWCVSAWNDNGKADLVDQNAVGLLHRTDFFPGLGWMLTRETWAELAPKWPAAYWDDWLRRPEQRKERACIRPELSRTRTFGESGVSNGHFYDKHLKFIKLNKKIVNFTKKNLEYLLKDNYDFHFVRQVYRSPVVTYEKLSSGSIVSPGSVRIIYHTKEAFKRTARVLGLMDDFRSGVPRTAYRGVVSLMYKGRRVYLAPSANWKSYDPSWS